MVDTVALSSDLVKPAGAPPLASWSRRVVAALLDGAILTGATPGWCSGRAAWGRR